MKEILLCTCWIEKTSTERRNFHTKLRERIFRSSSSENWLNRHLSFGLAFKNLKAKVLAELEFSHIFRETCAEELAATNDDDEGGI